MIRPPGRRAVLSAVLGAGCGLAATMARPSRSLGADSGQAGARASSPVTTPVAGSASAMPPASAAETVSPRVVPAVNAAIARISARMADRKLAAMFGACLPNTLQTAIIAGTMDGRPDSFILTGDIPAMWLRDAACQMHPYVSFARGDAELRLLFRGLFDRVARAIAIDPYANAFWRDPGDTRRLAWAAQDETEMRPGVAERKWEVDSLCFPIWLAHAYLDATGDARPFDAAWWRAMDSVVDTLDTQRRLHGRGPYHFRRPSPQPSESQFGEGWGMPARPCGLIHTAFRPSDDACVLPFNIPGNLFAAHALDLLARLAARAGGPAPLGRRAARLSASVGRACARFGVMRHADGPPSWAYEVDGFGNAFFMDDANLPSLLALPYLGICQNTDPLYRATRARAWSGADPYFFSGRHGCGIGGPHEGQGMIWPMSLVTLALTARDDAEIAGCLVALRDTTAGSNLLHESFDADDPARFTRPWFAWVNGLFGELILRLARTRPELLTRPLPARLPCPPRLFPSAPVIRTMP